LTRHLPHFRHDFPLTGPESTRIQHVYDQDLHVDLTWESSCSLGRGGACIPGEAWLGMYTRGLQPDVKCFKIYQPLETWWKFFGKTAPCQDGPGWLLFLEGSKVRRISFIFNNGS
jgi:hypothetical protein